MSGYGAIGEDNKPLFGEATSRDKVLNLIVVFITFAIVSVTFVVSIIHKHIVIHIALASVNFLFFLSHATIVISLL